MKPLSYAERRIASAAPGVSTERCFGCGAQRRQFRDYLCTRCWYQLLPETRIRLRESSGKDQARDRLFQLLSALYRNIPLEEIRVSA